MTWHTFDPDIHTATLLAEFQLGERRYLTMEETSTLFTELHKCYEFIANRSQDDKVIMSETPNVMTENRILTKENDSFKEALSEIDRVIGVLLEAGDRVELALQVVRRDL